jgi:hypothetical protein
LAQEAADQAASAAAAAEQLDFDQIHAAAKASARAKLAAIGLTEAEINALVGA